MARLLVSVRSAEEARAAVDGGACLIDVKEPGRGPLGRADPSVWSEVRSVVPPGIPVSLALGELDEWAGKPSPFAVRGFAFCKLGLAGARSGWEGRWERFRSLCGAGPSWVAVIYADWEHARAPAPDRVLDVALKAPDCSGVLIDTWDKSRPSPVDLSWRPLFDRSRTAGRFTALAGGLDARTIEALSSLSPDIIAVRGAACFGGDRSARVDPTRVVALARLAAKVGPALDGFESCPTRNSK